MQQCRVNGWICSPAAVKRLHANQTISINNAQFLEVKLKNAEQQIMLLFLIC